MEPSFSNNSSLLSSILAVKKCSSKASFELSKIVLEESNIFPFVT